MVSAMGTMPTPANSSNPRTMEVRGQLVTPQKTAIMPAAAENSGGNPTSGPTVQPNVAPMKKAGTISPPRKPERRVRTVKRIFSRNA